MILTLPRFLLPATVAAWSTTAAVGAQHSAAAASPLRHNNNRRQETTNDIQVSVRFYGEAMCPFCRKFVEQIPTWLDNDELRPYLDFDFVAWGNAYFCTEECGCFGSHYNSQVRQCWFQTCIASSTDNDENCFGSKIIYQHGDKEGGLDVYETCVKDMFGLEAAVDFMVCVEGPNMDNHRGMSAQQLMELCLSNNNDSSSNKVQDCMETNGHAIQVSNAKKTPAHAGVPYVVVDGKALEDPLNVQEAICQSLEAQGVTGLESCKEE